MITYDSLKTKKKVQNILCIINLVTDEQKSGGKKLHKVAGTTVDRERSQRRGFKGSGHKKEKPFNQNVTFLASIM